MKNLFRINLFKSSSNLFKSKNFVKFNAFKFNNNSRNPDFEGEGQGHQRPNKSIRPPRQEIFEEEQNDSRGGRQDRGFSRPPRTGGNEEGRFEIFVSGLPYQASEEEIANVFSSFGNITNVKIVNDRETGRSRGFGFVKFETEEQARRAAEGGESLSMQGRSLMVRVAEPKGQKPERQERSFDRPSSQDVGDADTIFVGNLSFNTTEDSLRDHFASCGEVLEARVPLNAEGRSRGFAFVKFASPEGVKAALNKNADLDGRTLRLDISTRKRDEDRGSRGGDRGYSRGGDRDGYSRGGDRGYSRGGDRGYSRGGDRDSYSGDSRGGDRSSGFSRGRSNDGFSKRGGRGDDDMF